MPVALSKQYDFEVNLSRLINEVVTQVQG